jgi:hypothetical protein
VRGERPEFRSGKSTRDYPLTYEEVNELGLPVSTDMPALDVNPGDEGILDALEALDSKREAAA